MEKSTGKNLKTFHTDNGGEYTSKRFEEFLKSEGIWHECTIPKTPEQNGVVERLDRTLVESARSMLLDARLPHEFWAEATFTDVYIRNRCPTKAVSEMMPYEAWYGDKPKVEHLRVFGCDAYSHIPKDERSKFDSKARKCILLGYGNQTKGLNENYFTAVMSSSMKARRIESEIVSNEDSGHHLVIDFSSDLDSESPTDNQAPIKSVPEKIKRRETTTELLRKGANPFHRIVTRTNFS